MNVNEKIIRIYSFCPFSSWNTRQINLMRSTSPCRGPVLKAWAKFIYFPISERKCCTCYTLFLESTLYCVLCHWMATTEGVIRNFKKNENFNKSLIWKSAWGNTRFFKYNVCILAFKLGHNPICHGKLYMIKTYKYLFIK